MGEVLSGWSSSVQAYFFLTKIVFPGLILHGGNKGRLSPCPLVITSVTLKDSRNLQFSHLGCPLPRRKCLSALALFKSWSIQAYLPSICDSNQSKNTCFYLREGNTISSGQSLGIQHGHSTLRWSSSTQYPPNPRQENENLHFSTPLTLSPHFFISLDPCMSIDTF